MKRLVMILVLSTVQCPQPRVSLSCSVLRTAPLFNYEDAPRPRTLTTRRSGSTVAITSSR